MAIRYRNAGFTLLEVLITLVIAGLLISLASLAISRNPRTELVETGEQLALLFESATDEAHIRARQIAWQPVRGGYRFSILENGGWKPLRDALYAPRNWPAPVDRVFIETPGAPPHISAERVIFGAESIAQPVIVTLCKGEICVHIAGSGDGRYRVRS